MYLCVSVKVYVLAWVSALLIGLRIFFPRKKSAMILDI